eukprot:GHVP01015686.1.p1 GENE.GHVP01015686.1~~GHVP01015686.1.p1  ORF type:complete len:1577 (+),score=210.74 GHVP01015686.1:46-4776(+)
MASTLKAILYRNFKLEIRRYGSFIFLLVVPVAISLLLLWPRIKFPFYEVEDTLYSDPNFDSCMAATYGPLAFGWNTKTITEEVVKRIEGEIGESINDFIEKLGWDDLYPTDHPEFLSQFLCYLGERKISRPLFFNTRELYGFKLGSLPFFLYNHGRLIIGPQEGDELCNTILSDLENFIVLTSPFVYGSQRSILPDPDRLDESDKLFWQMPKSYRDMDNNEFYTLFRAGLIQDSYEHERRLSSFEFGKARPEDVFRKVESGSLENYLRNQLSTGLPPLLAIECTINSSEKDIKNADLNIRMRAYNGDVPWTAASWTFPYDGHLKVFYPLDSRAYLSGEVRFSRRTTPSFIDIQTLLYGFYEKAYGIRDVALHRKSDDQSCYVDCGSSGLGCTSVCAIVYNASSRNHAISWKVSRHLNNLWMHCSSIAIDQLSMGHCIGEVLHTACEACKIPNAFELFAEKTSLFKFDGKKITFQSLSDHFDDFAFPFTVFGPTASETVIQLKLCSQAFGLIAMLPENHKINALARFVAAIQNRNISDNRCAYDETVPISSDYFRYGMITNQITSAYTGGTGAFPLVEYILTNSFARQYIEAMTYNVTNWISPIRIHEVPYATEPGVIDPMPETIRKVVLGGLLPIFCYLVPMTNSIRLSLTDKNSSFRSILYVAGLRPWELFFGNFVISMVEFSAVSLLIAVIIGMQSHFISTTFILCFGLAFFQSLSIWAFAVLWGETISSPAAATSGGIVLTILLSLPAIIIVYIPNKINRAGRLPLLLLYPSNIIFGISWIQGKGINSASLANVNSQYQLVALSECFYFSILDAVVMTLLAGYVSQLFPGKYGSRRPFYYPIQSIKNRFFPSKIVEEGGLVQFLEEINNTSEKVIEVKGIGKKYGKDLVTSGNVFDVYKNEKFGVIGQNGVGKTTMLGLLTGLVTPSFGDAFINGKSVKTNLRAARKSIGICTQHEGLIENLTVYEHLKVFALISDMKSNEIDINIETLCKALGMEEKINARCDQLSGGQKRRVSIAIAFVGKVDTVFLDEPSSGMDISTKRLFWNFLRSVTSTVIICTHDLLEAESICDRILVIQKPSVVAIGSSDFIKGARDTGVLIGVRFAEALSLENLKRFKKEIFETCKNAQYKEVEDDFHLITISTASQLSCFITKLKSDDWKKTFNISTLKLSTETLEDAFLNADKQENKGVSFRNSIPNQINDQVDTRFFDLIPAFEQDNWGKTASNFQAQLYKKLNLLRRKWVVYLIMLVVPIIFAFIFSLSVSQVMKFVTLSEQVPISGESLQRFEVRRPLANNDQITSADNSVAIHMNERAFESTSNLEVPGMDVFDVNVGLYNNAHDLDHMLLENRNDGVKPEIGKAGFFSIYALDSTDSTSEPSERALPDSRITALEWEQDEIKIFYNTEYRESIPLAFHWYAVNSLMKKAKEIGDGFWKLTNRYSMTINSKALETSFTSTSSIFFVQALTLPSAFCALLLQQDYISGSRHTSHLAYQTSAIYLLVTNFIDYILHLIILGLMTLFVWAIGGTSGGDLKLQYALLGLVFPYSMLNFSYVFSILVPNSQVALVVIPVFQIKS